MSKPIVLILLIVLALFTVVTVIADPITVNTTGTVSTSPTTSARLFRNAIPSDCGGKTYPGQFGSGPYGYTVEGPFGPAGTSNCVTVTWDIGTCDTNVIPVAFRGTSFDPAWGSTNSADYLGDAGSSISGSFSFSVAAGDSFVLVFMNTSSLLGCDYSYSLTYDGAASGPVCTLPVPEGSVVGDIPFSAQVYYAPGSASPGVLLNPGTYIVIGQDASETYYEIVLACQYVWVLKSNVQPSYQAPQNGAALPTRIIVEASTSTLLEAGPANDLGAS